MRALRGIEEEVISAQTFDHNQKDLEIASARVALALSELELARKTLEMVEAKLTHYTIYASQNGIIANRWVWLGDTVSPGQTLYTLVDLEDVWVLARLEETKMAHVKLGDFVKIHVDAYPNYTFHGEIFAIKGATASTFSPIPSNNATGNYTKVAQRVPIKMTIEPPDDFPKDQPLYLFPGMNVEVTIETRR
ncbi:MAG: HlyD family secretion protein [Verrucomicrobia bacterium]|nr:HlyD family secretion protein [Verrucomicrobiota bacterium]